MSKDKQKAGEQPKEVGEEALIEIRRGKAAELRGEGKNPFANDVSGEARSFVKALREEYAAALTDSAELRYDAAKVDELAAGKPEVTVLGRLMARRGFGKVAFMELRDGSGTIQIFAKQDVLGDEFPVLSQIDIADHLEVIGRVMVTKTGELSVEAQHLRVLTKALRPLPDKWHGLSDVDLRYRRRYVDLVANPDVAVVMRARTLIVQGLRDYLDGLGFMEVETPTLHPLIGGAAARPFETHHNALDMQLFMRIAPELYLKRLLCGGFERVYELARCFRNEGISTRHNPEFTMLEFYRAYATYETLMQMTQDMFRHVDAYLKQGLEKLGLGSHYEKWVAERKFSLSEPFARVPMKQAVSRACEAAQIPAELMGQLQEIAVSDDLSADARAKGDELIRDYAKRSERAGSIDWKNLRKGLSVCESDGERLFAAYEYLAEPFLPQDYRSQDGSKSLPVFIIDYPFEVSPLARRKDSDPALTDRFELFAEGREICNAFSELNDPDDQASRFRDQVAKKSRGADETMDFDEDYIRALEHGMPPAAGFGMGVDRFTMLLTGMSSIRDVIAFPLMRPEAPAARG
ncbi:MAG: lysine--tRNA ligase [Polyangiaceae bacterium]|nr:lysine--tRNA ligase [Polyangiaceae bacterium]MCB9607612.1 lysine--tRNA ligase [Polyangiaceae bacterium]